MSDYLEGDTLRRQANTVVRLTVVTTFGLIGTVATGFLGMNLLALAEAPLLEKLGYFFVVLIPVTGDHFLHDREVEAAVGLSRSDLRRAAARSSEAQELARRVENGPRPAAISTPGQFAIRNARGAGRRLIFCP